ncbi:MAG: diguanylate cyclase [Lysobacteraceae bacterium]|nr:MAG: diguanylate cyclase [Xanthomonadaceae bacterium]
MLRHAACMRSFVASILCTCMRTLRRACVVAAWLALPIASFAHAADDFALDGAWRPAAAGEPVESVAWPDPRMQRFDPARLQTFAADGAVRWIVLLPAEGAWPPPPWVLEVIGPGLQRVAVFADDGSSIAENWIGDADRAWPGHGRLAFAIDRALPASAPLRVRLDSADVIPSALHFAARSVPDHLRVDARWLALASACLAIMAAMSVVALFFGTRLRDAAFLYYALYVAAYAFVMAMQEGYLFEPLGWKAIAQAPRMWGRLATVASVVAAVLFVARFADLARCAPHMRKLLLGYAAIVAALGLAGAIPSTGAALRALINPLLIAGAPLLLAASALAAWRGSRYARFFLLGWTPLLVVTALGSAQLYGVAPEWTWTAPAALVAGAYEALVLSLGLADRALALRRAHDQARQLADVDPLTGLYNRRAWSRLLPAVRDKARARDAPLTVLFLDLDDFKRLNDQHGHAAGDEVLLELARVLRSELRAQDLIGRFGGEEFVVALPGIDAAHATRIAVRIGQRLELGSLEAIGVTCTVSTGVASLQPHENTDDLLRRADEAMYAAKAAGRNRVVLSSQVPEPA